MKITERLALLKAGYTKDDITAMLEEEKLQAENEEVKPLDTMPDEYANVLQALASEVKGLKETVQASNRDNVSVLGTSDKAKEVNDILEGLINPIKNKEE